MGDCSEEPERLINLSKDLVEDHRSRPALLAPGAAGTQSTRRRRPPKGPDYCRQFEDQAGFCPGP